MITVTARFKLKPEKREEALQQLRTMVQSVEANESGALAYACHTSVEDPSEVLFVEVYADKEAMAAHQKTAHMQEMRRVFGDLFVPPVKVERFDRIEGFARHASE